MLRSILGGIVGYIALFVFIFATFSILYIAIGTERAFEPGSYKVSMLWIGASTVLGLIGAVVGGYVAALVGKGSGGVMALTIIILLMGIVTILMVMGSSAADAVRAADVANLEAMGKAQTPLWVAILNPVIGIIGAQIGGRLRKN
jgi:hypothetical protein